MNVRALQKTDKHKRVEKIIDEFVLQLGDNGIDTDRIKWEVQRIRDFVFRSYREKQKSRLHQRLVYAMLTAKPQPPSSNVGIMFWLAKNHNAEGAVLHDLEQYGDSAEGMVAEAAKEYRRKKKHAA